MFRNIQFWIGVLLGLLIVWAAFHDDYTPPERTTYHHL